MFIHIATTFLFEELLITLSNQVQLQMVQQAIAMDIVALHQLQQIVSIIEILSLIHTGPL